MLSGVTFVELPAYTRRAADLLDEAAQLDLCVRLLGQPGAGPVIPGAGGLRKLRVAAKGHGRRGGARVIYYWQDAAGIIWLCRIYAKNEAENLPAAEVKKIHFELSQ
jgi:mRNA-degrading endonuclease RelE of RelBE toxin-antitoxin system